MSENNAFFPPLLPLFLFGQHWQILHKMIEDGYCLMVCNTCNSQATTLSCLCSRTWLIPAVGGGGASGSSSSTTGAGSSSSAAISSGSSYTLKTLVNCVLVCDKNYKVPKHPNHSNLDFSPCFDFFFFLIWNRPSCLTSVYTDLDAWKSSSFLRSSILINVPSYFLCN